MKLDKNFLFKRQNLLPIILTKIKKVLLIGGGRAVEIKLKTLSRYNYEITIVSKEFLESLKEYKFKAIKKDFYELKFDFFDEFDLIYIGIDLKNEEMVKKLLQTKLVNLLSNPSLSNFIHPCSREKEEIIVSVSTKGKAPKRACELADRFICQI